MSNSEFDWTEILPEPERSKVRAAQRAGLVEFIDSFPTKEELEQAGREGREAFAKACAEVDTVREAQADDTPESVAKEIAYFEEHADRFAAAHKGIPGLAQALSDPCPVCGINRNSPFPCEHTDLAQQPRETD